MRIFRWILGSMAALMILFIGVNWSAMNQLTPLSFIVTTVEAPLGVLLLGMGLVIFSVVIAYALRIQITAFADSRRQAAELKAQRELADKAEQSRFLELRSAIEAEFAAIRQLQSQSEARMRDDLRESINSLAAYLGEIDDRLERRSPSKSASVP
jgi:hypothetical protein